MPLIHTVAGTGVDSETGDAGAATSATLSKDSSLGVLGPSTYLYSDWPTADVRGFTLGGNIDRLAGTGATDPIGNTDGPVATTALAGTLVDTAVLGDGSFYVADAQWNRVRHVVGGNVVTAVGNNGNGIDVITPLSQPTSVATIPGTDQFYVSENDPDLIDPKLLLIDPTFQNSKIVASGFGKINRVEADPTNAGARGFYLDASDAFSGAWHIYTGDQNGVYADLAGGGGDSESNYIDAHFANIDYPTDITPAGGFQSIVFTEPSRNRVRMIDQGIIFTIAGFGVACPDPTAACGDGEPADAAQLNAPSAVAATPEGLLIGDEGDHRLRLVDSSRWITTPPALSNSAGGFFNFESWDPHAQFLCNLDGAGDQPCQHSFPYSGLADGGHEMVVTYVDPYGRPDPTPLTWDWTIDTTPPAPPTLDTHPPDPSNQSQADFSFTKSDAADTTECALDNLSDAGYTSCASPVSIAVPDGTHTGAVREIDAAGNRSTAVTFTWTVDTVAPSAPALTSCPQTPCTQGAPPYPTLNQAAASFAFTFGESGGAALCSLDNATPASFVPCTGHTDTNGTQSYTSGQLSQGSHVFYVRLDDAAGNQGAVTAYHWSKDTLKPAPPTLTGHPNSPTDGLSDFNFTFTPAEDPTVDPYTGDVVQCSINGAPYSPCDPPTSHTYTEPNGGFQEGAYNFAVREVDGAGNIGDPATYNWIVDRGDPGAPVITAKPADPTSSTTAAFTLTPAELGGSMRCALDASDTHNASLYTACDSLTTQTYNGLSEGSHTFSAYQIDIAGNPGLDPAHSTFNVATYTWHVDLTPPAAPALESPADNAGGLGPRPTFSWDTVADAAHYQLLIDDSVVATVDSCGATCSADAPSDLSESAHSWSVKAIDSAGNPSANNSTRSFNVAVAPVADVVAAPNPVLAGRTTTFDGSKSTDYGTGIADYRWDLDGDGTYETDTGATPTASRSYQLPASIKISLRVIDGVGLTSEAHTVLNVVAQPPAGKAVGISINNGAQFTNDPKVTLFSVWPSFATTMLVSNDGGFGDAQTFPVAEQLPWTLDSSGPERLPKTVYVRFQAAVPTTQNFTDDIILDQTPPKVVSAQLSGPVAAGAVASKAKLRTLLLKATDNVSGVGEVQVTPKKNQPGKLLKYKKKLKVKPAKKLFVRVQDRAGNFSSWKPVRG